MLAQAKSLAPNHEAVLNAMAIAALRAGNVPAARQLLEKSLERNPNVAGLWANLASACRSMGDIPAERAALDRALALAPNDYLAHLQKAELHEKLGEIREACGAFQTAMSCAPPADQVPPNIGARLNHGIELLRAQAAQLDQHLDAALASTRAQYDSKPSSRFERGLAAMLGKTRVFVSQATFLQIPELPALPFLATDQFPWLSMLEAQTDALAGEVSALLSEHPEGLVPAVDFQVVSGEPWQALNHSLSWARYDLWKDGLPVEAAVSHCPVLKAAIEQLPLADMPGNAPNVYLSVLQPGMAIPGHTGATNARALVHLPLVTPGPCRLRVGPEIRFYENGRAYVFDDTIENEAINESSSPQVVLVFDIWNPLLTESERALVRQTFVTLPGFTGTKSVFAGRL